MNRRLRWLALSSLGTTLTLIACSDVNADPIEGPGFDTGFDTQDAGTVSLPDDEPVACPDGITEDDQCNIGGQACEFGPNSDPACNQTFKCTSDPKYGLFWHETQSPTDKCRVQFCPPASQIVDGAPCTVPPLDGGARASDDEMQCLTDTQLCGCTTGPDGAHAHAPIWVCTTPTEQGCPVGRPDLGTTCLGDRLCDYGSCSFKRGTGMKCEDGVWQVEAVPCP